MIFVRHEIRQAVVPVPCIITAGLRPGIVVPRLATHINHAVDGAAAAQYLTSGVAQCAAIQARVALRLVHPIRARIADAIQITHGNMDPVVVISLSRLNQQHALGRISAQAIGKQTPRRSRADDDEVENCVAHFEVGMVNSAPLAILSGQRCMMDFWRV